MKKEIIYTVGVSASAARKISAFRGQTVRARVGKDIEFEPLQIVERDKTIESLLRQIYSCKDGQLNGELLTFMSEKVRPEVREFIKNQLLKVQKRINTHGLSDEDLSALSFNQGDTADSYHARVRTWLDKQIEASKPKSE